MGWAQGSCAWSQILNISVFEGVLWALGAIGIVKEECVWVAHSWGSSWRQLNIFTAQLSSGSVLCTYSITSGIKWEKESGKRFHNGEELKFLKWWALWESSHMCHSLNHLPYTWRTFSKNGKVRTTCQLLSLWQSFIFFSNNEESTRPGLLGD